MAHFDAQGAPRLKTWWDNISVHMKTDVCSTNKKPKPANCIFQILYCENPDRLGRGLLAWKTRIPW